MLFVLIDQVVIKRLNILKTIRKNYTTLYLQNSENIFYVITKKYNSFTYSIRYLDNRNKLPNLL